MLNLSIFCERLTDLMFENNITAKQLGVALGVNVSTVCRWKQCKRSISLYHAQNLAKYFNCSLEFLIGRTENKLDFITHPYQPFYERLRQLMNEHNVTWYRIVKDGVVSDNNISTWKNGSSPYLESVIDLADYFECTLDYLVGRES